jgi:hypothetical protein
MKDGILRAFGSAIALAVGFLATSCGTEATEPSSVALRAALGSADPMGFVLTRPNTTTDPSTGDIIRTSGSGSFDAAAGRIVANGSFTITTAEGSVVARGTWAATAFTSFVGFGGPNPGKLGGFLTFTATLSPGGASPIPGVPVAVTCRIFAPPGFTEEEGTTVGPSSLGDFTEKMVGKPPDVGGSTLFNQD